RFDDPPSRAGLHRCAASPVNGARNILEGCVSLRERRAFLVRPERCSMPRSRIPRGSINQQVWQVGKLASWTVNRPPGRRVVLSSNLRTTMTSVSHLHEPSTRRIGGLPVFG